MKARKITITAAQLNSGTYIETDLTYTGVDIKEYYPVAAQYINANSSSVILGFVCLANLNEKTEADADSTYYQYLILPSGNSVADLPPTKYLRIKLISGTATSDLDIYVYNYIQWIPQ